jgi:arylformamidase
MNKKRIYLSHFINKETPTYGNRNVVNLLKKSDMDKGDVANETHIQSTLHVGTHIDFPYHFYKDGQTLEDFPVDFWFFDNPLFVEVKPKSLVIKDELTEVLNPVKSKGKHDILLVKTGFGSKRGSRQYWEENIGFAPEIYDYLREHFPNIRILGFDSISVSSFQHRDIGRVTHRRFLNPEAPVLLLEDVDLSKIDNKCKLDNLVVVPLQIATCDGVPCTVFTTVVWE